MQKMKSILLSNPFKSFYWRSAMAALAFIAENLTTLGLPEFLTLAIGLALGELSKQLNKAWQKRKANIE